MSKHTPEPWRLGRACTVVSDTPVAGMKGSDAVEYYGGHLIGESIVDANARRIVACVNACAGMTADELDTIPLGFKRLQAAYLDLYNDRTEPAEKARDELLEAKEDHDRLVRELDVFLNGVDGAAKQASLCDLVAQLKAKGV